MLCLSITLWPLIFYQHFCVMHVYCLGEGIPRQRDSFSNHRTGRSAKSLEYGTTSPFRLMLKMFTNIHQKSLMCENDNDEFAHRPGNNDWLQLPYSANTQGQTWACPCLMYEIAQSMTQSFRHTHTQKWQQQQHGWDTIAASEPFEPLFGTEANFLQSTIAKLFL